MSTTSNTQPSVDALLQAIVAWAGTREDVLGVALVGSHARGAARPDSDSDVDIVLVARAAGALFSDDHWLAKFGRVASIGHEDYGLVHSRRVRYASGLEVEWGVTDAQWCVVDPLDASTAEVVAAGMRVLHDPNGIVSALAAAVAHS